MIKLHLGCGNKNLGKEWTHIDIQDLPHIDYKLDIRNLDVFRDSSVDEIYACHVLEHFPRKETTLILKEWNRVLKPGGLLRISVPDFENVCKLYVQNVEIEQLTGLVCGGQRNEYDYHYRIFDETSLGVTLVESGFTNVKRYDWRDFLPIGYDDYSRAYIPHMDFVNGTLVSLNIMATK